MDNIFNLWLECGVQLFPLNTLLKCYLNGWLSLKNKTKQNKQRIMTDTQQDKSY